MHGGCLVFSHWSVLFSHLRGLSGEHIRLHVPPVFHSIPAAFFQYSYSVVGGSGFVPSQTHLEK